MPDNPPETRDALDLLERFRVENLELQQRLKARRLTVEVEDPGAGGGLAVMTLQEAQRHARRASACGMLGFRLQRLRSRKLDSDDVAAVLLFLWMADPGLTAEGLLERLGPGEDPPGDQTRPT